MLRRKKQRIADGSGASEERSPGASEERSPGASAQSSIFARMQSKWGRVIGSHSHLRNGRKREAQRTVVSMRAPGIKLRARILLKKVKEKCGQLLFLSTKKKRSTDEDKRDDICSHAKSTPAMAAPKRTGVAAFSRKLRSPSQARHYHHHCHHHQFAQKHASDKERQPQCHYPLFPSLADTDAIAECIEFIKRSSSASACSSSSSSSRSSSLLT
ncbi:hypothetical protein KP509_34G038400 [Ceratopteris richardii]|uniref:Uncharacterized protein n=1 Tax=Ceratopteris richardii TaxID=49495 RepID=A0A8T2QKD5_CERRI|nr:hypothetical protein KP509_34G038400 [Ceratopteris richardii]